MPAPYDYSIGQVANPAQSFLQGIQMGDILRKREEDQAAAIEAKRAAAQRQAFMSQLMAKASAGTIKPADYEQLTMLDPTNYKAWSESIGRMNTAQKEAGFANMSGVYSALAMGTPEGVEVARRDLQTQLQAAENSDPQKAQTIKATLAQLDDPVSRSQLLIQSGVTLNGLDPERFKKLTENVAAQRAAPFEQRKIEAGASEAESKAAKAKVDVGAAESAAAKAKIEAQYAQPQALLDLEAKGWNIKKLRQEIETSQQQSRLALLQAQVAKEDKVLKRQELQAKIDEAKRKQSADLQQKVADVEGARFNIDNMLHTADRILQNPSLNSVIGTIQGRMPVVLSDEAQDAVALIETLGSQAFLSQIPNVKGMGALSNAEGEKLQNAFQNLGRVQSEKQFKENLTEAQRLLLKARQNVSTRYGVPETVPDTPAAKPAEGKSIDAILKELGVTK